MSLSRSHSSSMVRSINQSDEDSVSLTMTDQSGCQATSTTSLSYISNTANANSGNKIYFGE